MPNIDHGPVTLADLKGRNFAFSYEVASILRMDVRTVRTAIINGDVPGTKTGATYRVPVAWLRQQAGITAHASGSGDAA